MAVSLNRLVEERENAKRDAPLRRSPPWLAMGFRPFFLGAGLFGCAATLWWVHALTGGIDPGGGYLPMTLWHAHEMLFGYALAVVAGFLLTAARNWTGRNTLHGYPLLALVLVWLLGRFAMAGLLSLPALAVGVVGVAFPILLTVVLAWVIVGARSTRNYGIVAVLLALSAASLAVHLEATGLLLGGARAGIYGALHLIVMLNVVVGGRVIPMFTRNGAGVETRHQPAVDRMALVSAAAVTVLAVLHQALTLPHLPWALAGAAFASGVVQLLRMRTWGTMGSLRVPMVAVLHAGYAWIGVGHLLLGASMLLPRLSPSVAIHALTIGVIGVMTLGMMSRVTLGHTGRTITAPWPVTAAFVMMNLAALVRLLAAVLPSGAAAATWMVSGTLFAVAFLVYLVRFGRTLITSRPDGRAG
ncbi:MAG: NnrS family protein [Myxococcales bacterium]|nr:NnrS family protein [Myxococcales bacterium]